MGMYTELIFGASLKSNTPESVIDTLLYMIGYTEEKPKDFPFPERGVEYIFFGGSYYFGISSPVNKMWKDNISGQWIISTRSSIKNYKGEIECFLDWIKPYIESGSGDRDMYAIVMYEEWSEPKIHYLF